MTVHAWPADLGPSSISFFLEANTRVSTSPLSRITQVLSSPGARWVCRMEHARRSPEWSARLDAFLAQLDGAAARVALFDFRRPLPRGTAGTPGATTLFTDGFGFTDGTGFTEYASEPELALAAATNDETIYTTGWAVSETVLRAGDYIGLAGRLHMVLADVASDSGGNATLRLRPRLRGPASIGARVTFVRPTALFRLAENGVDNRTEPGRFSTFALTFVEALP